MLDFFFALTLVATLLLAYAALVRLVVPADSPLWRARRRAQASAVVRRETADLDREYASLVDEHRDLR